MKNRDVVRTCVLAALGVACLLPLACGSKDQPANSPTSATASAVGPTAPPSVYAGTLSSTAASPQPSALPPPQTSGQPSPTASGGAQPAPSGSTMGTVVTTDPNQLAALFGQAAQAGQALLQPPGTVAGDPIEAGIRASAAKNAAGMQPEGQMARGPLQEGGHLTFLVPMQAGKCYTIIGFSPPGQVKNLDLNLLAPPFYTFLAGQDTTDNNTPVVGKGTQPMCPIVPMPVQYKVDIVARSGSGQVGAQVYSKSR
jgi:hypothetical protein